MLATRFSRSGAPWFAAVLALASAPLLIANPEAGYSGRDDDSLIGNAASGIINGAEAVAEGAKAVPEEPARWSPAFGQSSDSWIPGSGQVSGRPTGGIPDELEEQ